MTDHTAIQSLHLIIHGRVQGVFFRASARLQARSLGLCGWVRNLGSGQVELMATGDGPSLQRLLDWCRQGPPQAAVTHISERWLSRAEPFEDFRQLPSV